MGHSVYTFHILPLSSIFILFHILYNFLWAPWKFRHTQHQDMNILPSSKSFITQLHLKHDTTKLWQKIDGSPHITYIQFINKFWWPKIFM